MTGWIFHAEIKDSERLATINYRKIFYTVCNLYTEFSPSFIFYFGILCVLLKLPPTGD